MILFPDHALDGELHLFLWPPAITLQGVRATSKGYPYEITSSDSSIVRVSGANKLFQK